MKVRIVILICVGLLAALCAAILVNSINKPAKSAGQEQAKAVSVVVAKKPLAERTMIAAADVGTRSVAAAEVGDAKAILDPSLVIGRMLAKPMQEGQLFTRSCVASEGSPAQMASLLGKGEREVKVSLSDFQALEGSLYPGCMVDVLGTFKIPGSNDDAVAKTLLQNVPVLTVEERTIFNADENSSSSTTPRASTTKKRIVGLRVNAKQAQILHLAADRGTISLAMRNPTDVAELAPEDTSLRELLGEAYFDDKAAPSGAAVTNILPRAARNGSAQTRPSDQQKWTVTIIRGQKIETRDFPMPG